MTRVAAWPKSAALALVSAFLLPWTGQADETDAARGKALFESLCAPCHGKQPGLDGSPLLPGSARLQTKYEGEPSPFLEDRDDLDFETLRFFIRNGVGTMPSFRKTEIVDAGIADIAAFLAAQGVDRDRR